MLAAVTLGLGVLTLAGIALAASRGGADVRREPRPALVAPAPGDAEQLEALLAELATEGRALGLSEVSFAVALPGGETAAYEGDRAFISASAAKLYWVAAALEIVGPEAVAPFAEPIFAASDNEAAAAVIELAGIPSINRFLREEAGLRETELVGWSYLEEGAFTGGRGENYTTAEDAVKFLVRLRGGDLLPPRETALLLEWMNLSPRAPEDAGAQASIIGNLLPGEARQGLRHKAGWIPAGATDVDHAVAVDMGLVPLPGGGWLALALEAAHPVDLDLVVSYLSRVACEVYGAAAEERLACPLVAFPPVSLPDAGEAVDTEPQAD